MRKATKLVQLILAVIFVAAGSAPVAAQRFTASAVNSNVNMLYGATTTLTIHVTYSSSPVFSGQVGHSAPSGHPCCFSFSDVSPAGGILSATGDFVISMADAGDHATNLPPFSVTFQVFDLAGGFSVPVTFNVTMVNPGITISASGPVSLTAGGSSQSVTIAVTRTSYTGSVALSVSGIPAGVTSSITDPVTGNSGTIALSAAANATLVSNQSITVTATGSGISAATTNFSLTVVPAPSISIASVVPSSITLSAGGAEQGVTATVTRTNFAGSVTLGLSSLPNGVTASITQPGAGNSGAITLQAAANASLVSGQPVTISASGSGVSSATSNFTVAVTATLPAIALSQNALSFGGVQGASNSSSQSVSISNSGGGTLNWTTTATGGSWLSVTPASGTGAGTVTVSVSLTGLSPGSLSGSIQIAAAGASNSPQTIGVTLIISPGACTFVLSSAGENFPNASGSGTVSVTAPSGCAWTVSTSDSWITITSGAGGSGSGQVFFLVASNTGTVSRTGTLSIAGETFIVTQAGASCGYSLSPTQQSFTVNGGTGQVAVTTSSSCDWTAISNAAFLSITAGNSGSGLGIVLFSVQANAFTNPRNGTLTIAGQTFIVTQAAASTDAVTVSVSPATVSFSAPADATPVASQQVIISSPVSGIAWTAQPVTQSGGSWLQVTPAAGVTPGVVVVSVNLAGLQVGTYRGTVTVQTPAASPSTQTVSVDLAVTTPLPPQLTVDPLTVTFEAQPGGGTPRPQVLRIAGSGSGVLTWTMRAETTAGGPWLIAAPTSGSISAGSADLVQVIANTSGLSAGVYSGSLRVESPTTGQSQAVAVTLFLTPVTQTILVSQTGLLFVGVEGGELVPAQSFGILNTGRGAMSWTVQANPFAGGNWMTISRSSGSSEGGSLLIPSVDVGVNLVGLRAGQYSGLIRVEAPDADNSPQFVAVDLTVLPPGSDPGILVRPTGLIFASVAGSFPPLPQTVRLTTARPGSLQLKSGPLTFDGNNWLDPQPRLASMAPSLPGTVTVQTSPSTLPPGVYRGAVTLLFSEGSSTTVNILSLVLGSSASAGSPFDADGPGQVAACNATRLLGVHRTLSPSALSSSPFTGMIEIQVVDDCGNAVADANVSASFSNGDPALSLTSLRNGTYLGTWRPVRPGSPVAVTVRVTRAPLAELQLSPVQVQVPSGVNTLVLFPGGVVNAASFAAREPLAPGSIVSIFGRGFAGRQTLASGLPLPTSLGQATLSVAGKEAPLFFTSSGQINAQLPFDLAPNSRPQAVVRTRLEGTGPQSVTLPETLVIVPAKPGIFSVSQDGKGQGAVLDGQGRFVDAKAPATTADVVAVYATGLGITQPAVPSGQPSPADKLALVTNIVTATVGGQPASVQFAGLAPGFVGLYQVNVQIPAGVTPGPVVPLVLVQNGVPSNKVTIAVR